MKKGDLVNVADIHKYDAIYKTRKLMMIRYTGEYRVPKIGEWFISGAIPEGYLVHTTLSCKEHIGELVEVRRVTTYEVVE